MRKRYNSRKGHGVQAMQLTVSRHISDEELKEEVKKLLRFVQPLLPVDVKVYGLEAVDEWYTREEAARMYAQLMSLLHHLPLVISSGLEEVIFYLNSRPPYTDLRFRVSGKGVFGIELRGTETRIAPVFSREFRSVLAEILRQHGISEPEYEPEDIYYRAWIYPDESIRLQFLSVYKPGENYVNLAYSRPEVAEKVHEFIIRELEPYIELAKSLTKLAFSIYEQIRTHFK